MSNPTPTRRHPTAIPDPTPPSPAHPEPRARGGHPGDRRRSAQLAVWQLNLLRVGYLVMVVGLAVRKWPLLFSHEPWGLAEGTKECLLIAMSFVALLGVRYPKRMLPILLYEVTWKLLWLGVVVVPLWSRGQLDAVTSARRATSFGSS